MEIIILSVNYEGGTDMEFFKPKKTQSSGNSQKKLFGSFVEQVVNLTF